MKRNYDLSELTEDCYCHKVNDKTNHVSHTFNRHVKRKLNIQETQDNNGDDKQTNDDDDDYDNELYEKEEDENNVIKPMYNNNNHCCTLKGTHTLDNYLVSKVNALPDSKEEKRLETDNLLDNVDQLIDTMTIDEFRSFYATQMAKCFPTNFDLYQLAVNVNRIKNKDDFTEWYNEWKAYENEKEKFEIFHNLKDHDYIYREEEQREKLTLRDSVTGTVIELTIENYVYSTHFFNKYTREPYQFNLNHLAERFLPFGVQYTNTKFAKIDFRTKWGSLLMFRSGGFIETGSKKESVSKKLLDFTMAYLRDHCGYKNIAIRKRICQNVVLTGSMNDSVCLEVLSRKYSFVTYDPVDFAGAIIRMEDVHKQALSSNHTYEDYEENNNEYEINEDVKQQQPLTINNDDDDDVTKNYSSLEVDNNHDDDDDTNYKKIKKEENYGEMKVKIEDQEWGSDYDEEDEDDDEEEEKEDPTLMKMDDLFNINTDAFYYEYLKNTGDKSFAKDKQKNNATVLLFERGTLICVGNGSRQEAKESLATLHPILVSCRATPENLIQEELFAAMRTAAPGTKSQINSKKRKSRETNASRRKKNKRQKIITLK
jgi:TATA-box binding protein (TBP) (component of TFIID and TFIIIB)